MGEKNELDGVSVFAGQLCLDHSFSAVSLFQPGIAAEEKAAIEEDCLPAGRRSGPVREGRRLW